MLVLSGGGKYLKLLARNVAFTLAEVLITLGIIGIVAALTLPGLLGNYKKQMYVSQLKKSVSTLEQGFRKAIADDGVDKLEDTQLWNKIDHSIYSDNGPEASDEFWSSLKKYFNILSTSPQEYSTYYLNGDAVDNEEKFNDMHNTVQFADGSCIIQFFLMQNPSKRGEQDCQMIKEHGGTMCGYHGDMTIDVNCRKGPNVYGRDIFHFILSEEGLLYPFAGKEWALYAYYSKPLDESPSYWRNFSKPCGTNGSSGTDCSAYLVENGWIMDY